MFDVGSREKYFTRLPLVRIRVNFHQSNQLTLLADPPRPAGCLIPGGDAVTVANRFDLLNLKFNGWPV
jgi:hypothetical protein